MVNGSAQMRRERILSATAELIRRGGIAALTTKNIAAEAGCAEGTIFRHFGDKGGLIAAVLSFGLPEISRIEELATREPTGDLEADLTSLCAAVLAFYEASYPIAAGALSDSAIFRRYQAAHQAGGTGPRQIWELVHRYLRAAQARGLVASGHDLEIEAIGLVGSCQNAVWVRLVNGDEALPHHGRDLAARIARSRVRGLS